MARIRYKLSYSDTSAELVDHKAQKRGASEDAFWDEDELVDHRPNRKNKKKTKGQPCPASDDNYHVWIWVDWLWNQEWFTGPSGFEIKVCCGCEKKSQGRKSFRRK